MKPDMSSEAIEKRLRQVEALRRLCVSLAKAHRTRKGDKVDPGGAVVSHGEG